MILRVFDENADIMRIDGTKICFTQKILSMFAVNVTNMDNVNISLCFGTGHVKAAYFVPCLFTNLHRGRRSPIPTRT